MDSVSETFNCICRLCLKLYNCGQMSPLVNSANKLSSYGRIVRSISNITVEINDKLPPNLCDKCKQELDRIQSFLSMCESNNRSLVLLVNNEYKNSTLDEKKEIICTYAMYRHYLPDTCSESPKSEVKEIINPPKTSITDPDENFEDVSTNYDDKNNFSDASFKGEDEVTESTDNVDTLFSTMEKLYSSKLIRTRKKIHRLTNMKVKKTPQSHICPICNKKLANSVTFQGHMNTHEQNKFICDQCGKAMSTNMALLTHLVAKHKVPSRFECDYCGFGAPRRHELIEHIRLHTGERPFTCDKCGMTFRRRAIWRLHLKIHGDRLFSCSLCPRKFARSSGLKGHMNNVHDRMYLYLCKICDTSYAHGGTVRKHMISEHGIPREAQGKITRVTKATHRSLFQDKNNRNND